jgi:hypothetical protein
MLISKSTVRGAPGTVVAFCSAFLRSTRVKKLEIDLR